MKTQTEVEMEDEDPNGGISEPFFTIEEEEDVIVIWKDKGGEPQQRDLRSLAMSVQESASREDVAVLKYYR